ncbi:MAG: hypothetical protein FWF50_05890 [Defluviitaleaceae bacterium]|nr:hypothetical protein [Defluviitaleaceae bacterium]
MLYFEIYRNKKLLRRGTSSLNPLSFSNELMFVPTLQLDLPIDYLTYRDEQGNRRKIIGREEIKVFINDKLFHGIITSIELNKIAETITLTLHHIIYEWVNRQLTTNLAIKNKKISYLYDEFTFDLTEIPVFKFSTDWQIIYGEDEKGENIGNREIEYVYSRQNLLDALNKTCELTPDLFWRVNFQPLFLKNIQSNDDAENENAPNSRILEIGTFGKKKNYIISTQPNGTYNIQMISEPRIIHHFDHVVNVAIVYGEKSDSGMTSVTLRDIFESANRKNKKSQNRDSETEDETPNLQNPDFPVFIIKEQANNERHYKCIDYTELAPNAYFEYAVLDRESIKLEAGQIIEGSFSFNDLSPFSVPSDEDPNEDGTTEERRAEILESNYVNNRDRIKSAQIVYDSAVRRLKQSRRYYQIEIDVSKLPIDLNVGDRIRFIYDNQMLALSECTNYMKKVLQKDDWYYITKIDYSIDSSGIEHSTLTLEKYLRIGRESSLK